MPVLLIVDRVACCPLVSHDEYADGTDIRRRSVGRTDGRQTVTLRFLLDAASLIICFSLSGVHSKSQLFIIVADGSETGVGRPDTSTLLSGAAPHRPTVTAHCRSSSDGV